MAKARCNHGPLWFMVCPWCKSEAEDAAYIAEDMSLFPYWRNMTPADVQTAFRRTAHYLRFRQFLERSF